VVYLTYKKDGEIMLDKAILSKKEHRREYRGSKSIDRTCRNHGGCPYCIDNRLASSKRRSPIVFIEDVIDSIGNDFVSIFEVSRKSVKY